MDYETTEDNNNIYHDNLYHSNNKNTYSIKLTINQYNNLKIIDNNDIICNYKNIIDLLDLNQCNEESLLHLIRSRYNIGHI